MFFVRHSVKYNILRLIRRRCFARIDHRGKKVVYDSRGLVDKSAYLHNLLIEKIIIQKYFIFWILLCLDGQVAENINPNTPVRFPFGRHTVIVVFDPVKMFFRTYAYTDLFHEKFRDVLFPFFPLIVHK